MTSGPVQPDRARRGLPHGRKSGSAPVTTTIGAAVATGIGATIGAASIRQSTRRGDTSSVRAHVVREAEVLLVAGLPLGIEVDEEATGRQQGQDREQTGEWMKAHG
jgi:hypothetical protein